MSMDLMPRVAPSGSVTDSGSRSRSTSALRLFGAGLLVPGGFTMSSAVVPQDIGASTSVLTSQHVIHGTNQLTPSQRVSKLKEESGLTWGQIAELFGVSRRAVHFWVEGGNMVAHNVERLLRLEEARRAINGVGPTAVRNGFFTVTANGQSPFAKLLSEIAPTGPRLMAGPPIESSRPAISIGPTVPVATVDSPLS